MIEIYKPKWEGNSIRRIGLADYRLRLEGNIVEINITYKTKEGLRLYPDPFYMRKTDIVHYPVENASGTKVYVVPIADLSTSPTLEHKYVEYDLDCPNCKVQMRQNMHKHTVSYKCPKCNKISPIQWETEPIVPSVATNTSKGVDKNPEVPVISKVVTETQSNLDI
jgi:predicted RNA-binding Zn-ribbon protein involved in translation (DUF1610 family)